jgi:hypothetical protein
MVEMPQRGPAADSHVGRVERQAAKQAAAGHTVAGAVPGRTVRASRAASLNT